MNTRRVFAEAKKAGLGRMIVLNKMDAENIDFPALLESIQEMFGKACLLLNVPLGQGADFRGVASTLSPPADTAGALVDPAEISQSLLESIIEVDEAVMERYFEGTPPTAEELPRLDPAGGRRRGADSHRLRLGKTGVGLPELMDALAVCVPTPDADRADGRQRRRRAGRAPGRPGRAAGRPGVQDPHRPLRAEDQFHPRLLGHDEEGRDGAGRRPAQGAEARPSSSEVQANETQPVDDAGPGEIVAVIKMEDLRTGMTLGELTMPPIPFPSPMVGLAVTPKSRGDETKLSGALNKICQEDATFRIDRDAQTKEMVATGMSELHLQILRERLKRRDKVEVDTHEPKIPYRETIQINAEGSYRHKKQTGGRGQFGEVHIRMFPLPKDVNIEEWAVKARFPSLESLSLRRGQQLRLDRLGGRRHDPQQLPAGRSKRASRTGSSGA